MQKVSKPRFFNIRFASSKPAPKCSGLWPVSYTHLEVLGYAEDGVGVAENDFFKANMTDEEMATFKEFADKLKAGEVDVCLLYTSRCV